MTGFTDYFARAVLNYLVGRAAMPSLPASIYVGLFTGVGSNNALGFTEVSGSAYARSQTTAGSWGASSGSAPSLITNITSIAFPLSAGSWGTVFAFGLFDALSGGNLLAWDYLGNFLWLPCAISNGSPCVITAPAHGYSAADSVVYSVQYGGTSPVFTQSSLTGLLAISSSSLATDSFTVTNNGGIPVNTSSTGNGAVRKVLQQQISNNNNVTFAPGALTITSG